MNGLNSKDKSWYFDFNFNVVLYKTNEFKNFKS